MSLLLLHSEYVVYSALCTGLFWQQSAGIGHDLGHSSVAAVRTTNIFIGCLLSSITGLSSSWWRHSHFQHHIHTNVKREDPDIIHAPIFSVSEKLFQPFKHNFLDKYIQFESLALVRVQHLLMYPVMSVARLNLYAQSAAFLLNPPHPATPIIQMERCGMCLFWSMLMSLYFSIGAWRWCIYFTVSHVISGITHVQIIISHWACAITDSKEHMDHYMHTLTTTTDIETWPSNDWFHIGLQYQVAHHMFPRLPRYRLRAATDLIRAICARHELPYTQRSFYTLNCELFSHMRHVALITRGIDMVRVQHYAH